MERFDVTEHDRLAEMVDAAERGETVEITRRGRTVARVVGELSAEDPDKGGTELDLEALERLHASLPPEVRAIDWTAAVRQMREDDRF